MKGTYTKEFTEDDRKRIWDAERKPWEGNEASIETIKKRIWQSLYNLTDKSGDKFTASEVSAASMLVSQEAVNHGAIDQGFKSLYDIDETRKEATRLLDKYQSNRREYFTTRKSEAV
jgi:protein associated with RNAse G/E